MQQLLKTVSLYEKWFGQKVNTTKFAIFFSSKISWVRNKSLLQLTGFVESLFPFIYLGALIYLGKMTRQLLDPFVHKLQFKVATWKGNLLSQGGRLVLIQHVLSSMVIHTLAFLSLFEGVIQKINSIMSTLFWGVSNSSGKRKWGAWDNLCN